MVRAKVYHLEEAGDPDDGRNDAIEKRYPWLKSHPHLAIGWPANNTVYVARERLVLPASRSGSR